MAKPRILIIEDERGLTDVLSYNLLREGYDILVAHDGQEGLRKVQMQVRHLLRRVGSRQLAIDVYRHSLEAGRAVDLRVLC